jgi:hypothetical protein
MAAHGYDWRGSPPNPSGRPHPTASAPQRTSVRRTQTVPGVTTRAPRAAQTTSWFLNDSAGASREIFESRAHEFYSPYHLSSTGHIRTDRARDDSYGDYSGNPQVRFDEPEPPPPPPKDPGYRPASGVRRQQQNASSWSLPILPSWRHSKVHDLFTSEKTRWGKSSNQQRRSPTRDPEKRTAGTRMAHKGSQLLHFLSRSIPRMGSSS